MSTSDRQSKEEAFSFTGEFAREAERNIAKYPKGRESSAVLALLFLAQQQNTSKDSNTKNSNTGQYVTRAAMEHIAQRLNMPLMRVMEVASFFTQINLSPVGKYHIQLCGTTPCMLRGSEGLKETLAKKLGLSVGETTADQLFTLTEVECLGACCNAPMVQINDDYYEDLTPDLLEELIDKLAAGKKVTPGPQQGRKGSEPASGRKTLLSSLPTGASK